MVIVEQMKEEKGETIRKVEGEVKELRMNVAKAIPPWVKAPPPPNPRGTAAEAKPKTALT